MNFDGFIADIVQNKWVVYGVEVYEHGVLTHSWGDAKDELHEIYSATKSVVSVAVGIAWDRGLIDVEKSILEYLPQEKVAAMPPAQKDTYSQLTVKRLLTMSVAGFPFRPAGDSYLDFALACELENPKEIAFNYSNLCTYLVGVALYKILGRDLGEFIEEEILNPLDITNYEYGRCPEGYFYGASQMKLAVHDLSKFGLLMMNGGVYNGKRILSEAYVKLATSAQIMNPSGGYGYYYWKYRDGFSINGKWMQRCYCLPAQELMVTFLGCIKDKNTPIEQSMEKHLLD